MRRERIAPVSVWISEPEDVMASQTVVSIFGRSLGIDSVDVFMAVAEAAEKGGALLAGATGCGRLVFTPKGSALRPRLVVEAQAAERRAGVRRDNDLAGVIGVPPALVSGGGPRHAGPRPAASIA